MKKLPTLFPHRLTSVKSLATHVVPAAIIVLAATLETPVLAHSARTIARPSSSPTARPATAAELAIFKKLMPANNRIVMYAVAGDYALVDFANEYSGVEMLLLRKNAGWIIKVKGGGYVTPDEFSQYLPGISVETAKSSDALGRSQDR